MKKSLMALALVGIACLPSSVRAEPSGRTFAFPMEGAGLWRIREPFRPAGEDGFISSRGHRLVDATGNVRRFFGVNLYGLAQMPAKQDAEQMAKTLAFWGFNAVRMMPQYTWQCRPDGDWAKGPDPELLDRFDYFFAKLKERGIYATMNLHSARTAGYRFKDFRLTMKENKGIDNFDPTFIRHQQEWDRFVFAHVNPYTGLAYRDEPAVLSWEINNECSLGITWFCWNLWKKMTPPFKAELTRQFGDWLQAKYGSTERVRAAWTVSSPLKPDVVPDGTWRDADAFARANWYTEGWARGGQGPRGYRFDAATGTVTVDANSVRKFALIGVPLDENEIYTVSLRIRSPRKGGFVLKVGQHGRPYANQGVNETFETGPEWREVRLCASSAVADGSNRVQLEFKAKGTYEIGALSFVRGGEAGLGAGETLEARSIAPVGAGSPVRAKDVADFILDVEDRYWKEMVRYLKEDLRSKQLVNGGTINYGAGYPQARADFIDQHFYYGGLASFPGTGWNTKNWNTSNRLMVRNLDDGRAAHGFSLRVFGLPYTISEASQMHQAATAADFFPILFSLSAFQDHAAIHAYTWTHAQDHRYGSRKWLDMHGNAKYLAHLPAARNMFVRGDVKSGFDEAARIVCERGREEEREQIRRSGFSGGSYDPEADPLAMVKAVTGMRYVDLEELRRRGRRRDETGRDETVRGETGRDETGRDETVRDETGRVETGREGAPEARERRAVSSTGEITWDATGKGCEYYAVDTPRTKFLSQFGPAGTSHRFADGTSFTLGETMMGWAALSLTETATNEWFLAATGWQQPTGAVVSDYAKRTPIRPEDEVRAEDRKITTMTAMGDVPFVCEGVRATIRLPSPANRLVRVTPLDGNALPADDSFDVLPKDGFVVFAIGEQYRTVWYKVEFREYDLPAFGAKIADSGYDPAKPDCGMTAAKVFDAPITGLTKVGELKIPTSREVPDDSTGSIGFEGLDRKLFEPTPAVYERLGAMGVKWARVLDDVVDRLAAYGLPARDCGSRVGADEMTGAFLIRAGWHGTGANAIV